MNTRLIGLQLGLIKSAYAGIVPAYPPVAGAPDSGVEIPADNFFGPAGVFDPVWPVTLLKRLKGLKSPQTLPETVVEASPINPQDNLAEIAKEWQKYTKTKYNPQKGGADEKAMKSVLGSLGDKNWKDLSDEEKYSLINPPTDFYSRKSKKK